MRNIKRYNKFIVESMLPIFDYKHNLREISKQIILLEDHISHPEKRCNDCITKHFLSIEGLADEAITLCKEYNKYLTNLPNRIRNIQKLYLSGNLKETLITLRSLRKEFMTSVFKITESDSYNKSLIDYATEIDDLSTLKHMRVKNTSNGKIGFINDEKIKKTTLPQHIRVSKTLTNDAGWIMNIFDLVMLTD